MKKVAPWTDEEVQSLNDYQIAGYVHPFTSLSGNDLVATRDGWIEVENGPIVQDWAHDWMCDGSWRVDFDTGIGNPSNLGRNETVYVKYEEENND